MLKAKPFVKWAGGKRQIIDKLLKLVPENYDTYYEPFVGGGALLFELSPKKAVINDSNKELMNVYRTIADDKGFEETLKLLNTYDTFIISIVKDIFLPTSKSLYTIFEGFDTKPGLSKSFLPIAKNVIF